jgi:pyruvate kinase
MLCCCCFAALRLFLCLFFCVFRYANLPKVVEVGSSILIDDGLIALEVVSKTPTSVTCAILNDGELGQNKGVNLPGALVDLPPVTVSQTVCVRVCVFPSYSCSFS